MNKKLTPLQIQFAKEYPVDLHIKNSAIRAGYTEKHAAKAGWRALQHPEVQKLIQKYMDERSERTEIKSDDVLREIAKSAFSNIKDLMNEQGQLIPVHLLPRDVAAAIAGIDVVTRRDPSGEATDVEYISKIKFWDKTKSLDQLGKHLKLFTDVHEHKFMPHEDALDALDE